MTAGASGMLRSGETSAIAAAAAGWRRIALLTGADPTVSRAGLEYEEALKIAGGRAELVRAAVEAARMGIGSLAANTCAIVAVCDSRSAGELACLLHSRRDPRRCRVCNPGANPPPMRIDGHEYHRRQKARRRRGR